MSTLPPPYEVAEGSTDQQVGWAVAQLYARGQEAITQAIRQIIAVELSVSEPKRTTVANALRRLSPRYLGRTEREEGPGYAYEPLEALSELFEDDA